MAAACREDLGTGREGTVAGTTSEKVKAHVAGVQVRIAAITLLQRFHIYLYNSE